MISVCAVTVTEDNLKNNEVFEPLFIQSVAKRLTLVSEILICKVTERKDFYEESRIGDIKVIKFGYKNDFFYDSPTATVRHDVTSMKLLNFGHSLGIKSCIDRASNDLVLLCDTDMFFFTNVDQFYYELMNKLKLHYIGACPHLSYLYASKYFPNILCTLTNRKNLPGKDFLQNSIITQNIICGNAGDCKVLYDDYYKDDEFLNGEYLVGNKIDSLAANFPNPTGLFDTGVYLYLWAKQNNQNWLGFQPLDIHLYRSQIYRTNLKVNERIAIKKLFYHATGGSRHLYLDQFLNEYNKEE